jgi:hypothetical protein
MLLLIFQLSPLQEVAKVLRKLSSQLWLREDRETGKHLVSMVLLMEITPPLL